MTTRSFLVLISLLITVPLRAEMVRVTAVHDGRTIAVERGGRSELLQLAGVEVTDEVRARELLRWTVGGGTSWVLAERSGDAWKVWRSPDALFVNEELVNRGYARATLPGIAPAPQLMVTYLGEVSPSGVQTARPPAPAASPKATKKSAPRTPKPPAAPKRVRRNPR